MTDMCDDGGKMRARWETYYLFNGKQDARNLETLRNRPILAYFFAPTPQAQDKRATPVSKDMQAGLVRYRLDCNLPPAC